MKLAKFLTLQAKEETLSEQLKRLFKNSNAAVALAGLIYRSDTGMLLKLALADPRVDVICKLPQFEDYWKDLWRQTGVNPRECAQENNEPMHENLPIPTISTFDLLKGLFIYEEYRRQLEGQTELTEKFFNEAEEYLLASARHGSYFAINALCKVGLELLDIKFDENIAHKVLVCAGIAAHLYLSPGYILLSNVYHEFVQHKNEACFVGVNLRIEAFKAAYMAERLEEHSTAMINNAYQGKTLKEASDGIIKDFSFAKTRVQRYLALNAHELSTAIASARKEVDSIVIQIATSTDATIPLVENLSL